MAESVAVEWPDNLTVQGRMTFPLYTEESLVQVAAWRERKKFAKPDYDEVTGFGLFLTQAQQDKIKKHLLEVYIPFASTLKKESGGKYGLDPKIILKLQKLVEEDDFSENNLPLRDLSDSDERNLEKNGFDNVVSKVRVLGPRDNGPVKIKALVKRDGMSSVVPITDDDVVEKMGEANDHTKLWWGASWPFRTELRFNAYQAQGFGISAYGTGVYLLADQELKQFSNNNSDVAVAEDGDDWEE